MGCCASTTLSKEIVSIEPQLTKTEKLPELDSIYENSEKVLKDLNTIGSGLLVKLDKFKTVCQLHYENRDIRHGLCALVLAIFVACKGDLLKIDFAILEGLPGVSLREDSMPLALKWPYLIWREIGSEFIDALVDLEALLPKLLQCIKDLMRDDILLCEASDSKSLKVSEEKKFKQILTDNRQKMQEAADYFAKLVKILKEEALKSINFWVHFDKNIEIYRSSGNKLQRYGELSPLDIITHHFEEVEYILKDI